MKSPLLPLKEKTNYDVIGIGNALIDIEILVTEEEFNTLDVTKNSMTLIDEKKRQFFLKQFEKKKKRYFSGGSAANTLYTLSQLHHKIGFVGTVGQDAWGKLFEKELGAYDAKFLTQPVDLGETGSCIVLITPDAHRTMLTTLGCAPKLAESIFKKDLFQNTKVFHIEGFMLNEKEQILKIFDMIRHAKQEKVLISISASDAFCVEAYPDEFSHLLQQADIFFSNAEELKALHTLKRDATVDLLELGKKTAEQVPLLIATDGENGANLFHNDVHEHIAAEKTHVVDTTGAGDAFAAGALDALLKNGTLREIGAAGTRYAAKVISHYGARQ